MDKRPYFSKTVDELENIFEENIKDRAILIELQKELSYRSRVRSKELAKKVKAILDAPYQLDLPIDIQISGEYDRTATWYGTIGWYENRVDEFKNDKNELQKILYTLLSWNFDDRTYNLIIKIQNILYQTEYKLKNYKNIIENRDKIPLCNRFSGHRKKSGLGQGIRMSRKYERNDKIALLYPANLLAAQTYFQLSFVFCTAQSRIWRAKFCYISVGYMFSSHMSNSFAESCPYHTPYQQADISSEIDSV